MSVIVPVHDVAEYLPEFLDSLEAQGSSLPADLVFIDDGSTDAGAALITEWIERTHVGARLIRTENRGVSAARNTGLDEAAREWVVFLDPDDVLAPGYFTSLLRFLGDHPQVDLAATNLLRLQEPDHRLRDTHPLRFRFAGGDRVAELADDVFVMNAASVAFPVGAVRRSGARFRTGLHASEDALFVAEYLLSLGRTPTAGFVASARYGYRKRAARTSAVDRYRVDPSTYTVRFAEGYAPLLERAATSGGVPSWLQSMLLYEMQWLLPTQMDPQRFAENLSDAQRAETLDGIARCLRHVSDERLLTYDASALPLECRLLILALTDRPLWHWVGAYATMPRGWRNAADLIAYSIGGDADAIEQSVISWCPDYFGQSALVAHRLRATGRVEMLGGRRVVWPRPGESLVQAQDRQRRLMSGFAGAAVPAQDGEVYVRRTRPWAPNARPIHREIRRRSLWSKDAMIGRVLRPGRSVLVEHLAEGGQRSREVAEALAKTVRTLQVTSAGASKAGGSLLFGSLAHRIARARARVIVSVQPARRPSIRARLRGRRVLILSGEVDAAMARSVRLFAPDLIIATDSADAARLQDVGIPADDILIAPGNNADAGRAMLERISDADDRAAERV